MTIAFWCVFIAAVLPYLPAVIAKAGGTGYDNNEPRAWLAKQDGVRARANAAQQNGFEAFGFFAVAVLVAHAVHGPMVSVNTAAMVFIAARVIYIPVYLAGWGKARSLIWAVGMFATVWIFLTAARVA